MGEEASRVVTRKIMKNKGLTRHRGKTSGNARIKHKNRYEKAQHKLIVIFLKKMWSINTNFRVRILSSEKREITMQEKSISVQEKSEVSNIEYSISGKLIFIVATWKIRVALFVFFVYQCGIIKSLYIKNLFKAIYPVFGVY